MRSDLDTTFTNKLQITKGNTPILNNVQIKHYVQNTVDQIFASPLFKYRNQLAYQVAIISNDKTVNAFATSSGDILFGFA